MKRPGMNFSIQIRGSFSRLILLLNLESRNISATLKNMQHILRRIHKSVISDADELQYLLTIVF